MPSKLPFFPQGRYDTCALACLRMILAQHGTEVTEDDLIRAAHMDDGGVDIEELAHLAESFGLRAVVRQVFIDDFPGLLGCEQFPILYLNRLPIDGRFAIHAVIPVRMSARFVTVFDPLRGQRRISKRKFEGGRRYLDHFGVVCAPAETRLPG